MTTIDLPATRAEVRHRRSALLRAAMNDIERTRNGELPWNSDLASVFADRSDLLRAIHASWSRGLVCRVDTALELDNDDLEPAVARAYASACDALPHVRTLLDRYAEEPALRRQDMLDHRVLAVAAGLATLADPLEHSAAIGRRIARSGR